MTRPTLVEFLTARLDEDEAAAERIETTSCHGVESDAEADYLLFARRACTECEAKRAIMDEHAVTPHPVRSWVNCSTCGARVGPACTTLIHLASVYADHPDYDATWAP
jgi:hypothetical protein